MHPNELNGLAKFGQLALIEIVELSNIDEFYIVQAGRMIRMSTQHKRNSIMNE